MYVYLYQNKNVMTEGKKCHVKIMMSRKYDESLKGIPNMCHLGRTLREKNEGGDYKRCGTDPDG